MWQRTFLSMNGDQGAACCAHLLVLGQTCFEQASLLVLCTLVRRVTHQPGLGADGVGEKSTSETHGQREPRGRYPHAAGLGCSHTPAPQNTHNTDRETETERARKRAKEGRRESATHTQSNMRGGGVSDRNSPAAQPRADGVRCEAGTAGTTTRGGKMPAAAIAPQRQWRRMMMARRREAGRGWLR